jgi:hypothetical protein
MDSEYYLSGLRIHAGVQSVNEFGKCKITHRLKADLIVGGIVMIVVNLLNSVVKELIDK